MPSFSSIGELPGQSEFSFWDSPQEEDILERWRRKCKSEIDVSFIVLIVSYIKTLNPGDPSSRHMLELVFTGMDTMTAELKRLQGS